MRPALWIIALAALAALAGCGPADKGSADTADSGDTADLAPSLRVPAEWEPQDAIWLQWPQRWESSYEPAFSRIISKVIQYEDVHILTNDAPTRASAEASLADDGGLDAAVVGGEPSAQGYRITWHEIPNDSAWLRDNGPRYVIQDGELRIQDWGFDAWGGAFGADIPYEADDAVPQALGDLLGLPVDPVELVHERGDLEFNGVDTVILNWTVIGDEARNPGLTREQAVAAMEERFGVTRVVLIEGAPEGDLTGGHVDGIARFIDADQVVVADCSDASACAPDGHDDQIYDGAAAALSDAGLDVIRWPFAGSVAYRGEAFDTDYMNWLVGNGFVITVGFDDPELDDAAVAQLEEWFPDRDVYSVETLASWYAGGGVHCHTNDQPSFDP